MGYNVFFSPHPPLGKPAPGGDVAMAVMIKDERALVFQTVALD